MHTTIQLLSCKGVTSSVYYSALLMHTHTCMRKNTVQFRLFMGSFEMSDLHVSGETDVDGDSPKARQRKKDTGKTKSINGLDSQ